MGVYIVQFKDLEISKQQEIIDDLKERLLEEYENEARFGRFGKNFGRTEYKNMSWQEAFVREYAIDFTLWEDEKDAKKFDWNMATEMVAEDHAREKCEATYMEWEVEV